MKTTKIIWEENTIEELTFDEFGRQRDVIRYFDNTNANQKWYSAEEIIEFIKKVEMRYSQYFNNEKESNYNRKIKKDAYEIFGEMITNENII